MSVDLPAVDEAPALGLNRCLRMSLMRDRDTPVGLEVRAPVPGEGLRITHVDAKSEPEVFSWLLALQERGQAGVLSIDPRGARYLQNAGVLAPRARLPRRVGYACDLHRHGGAGPLPPDLATSPCSSWIVNPSLRVLAGTGSFAAPWRCDPAADAQALAWLRLPGSTLAFAYWLRGDDADLLRGVASQRLAAADLPAERAQLYARAGVFTTRAELSLRAQCQQRRQRHRREQLARAGWVRLPRLVPAPLLRSLQPYVDALVAEGHMAFKDAQSNRFHDHSEPMAVWLHQQIEETVQQLAPDPIKRSYAFLARYMPGSELAAHVDRAQCEYTISITLDASPGRSRDQAWPLGLVDRGGVVRQVRLAPGDALLFKGRELSHFRAPLGPRRHSTSVFAHFVPVDFPAHLD